MAEHDEDFNVELDPNEAVCPSTGYTYNRHAPCPHHYMDDGECK